MKAKITMLVAIMTLAGFATYAQEGVQKIGHVDVDFVLQALPEFKVMENELKNHEAQLKAQMDAKQAEIQQKYNDYMQNAESMAEVIRADKEKEITALQTAYQEFTASAQASMQKKQGDLLNPVLAKIGTAIEEVAKENGYSQIFTAGTVGMEILLYGDDKYDISDLVLENIAAASAAGN